MGSEKAFALSDPHLSVVICISRHDDWMGREKAHFLDPGGRNLFDVVYTRRILKVGENVTNS